MPPTLVDAIATAKAFNIRPHQVFASQKNCNAVMGLSAHELTTVCCENLNDRVSFPVFVVVFTV
jgi:hypothetical protein